MIPNNNTLLIVDDSLIIRKAITKYLEDYAIQIVGTANNGNKALELYEKFHPEYVTLDITMPGIDGMLVLEEMVKIDDSSKIIVITALKDKSIGLKALKLGAVSYITKPFSPDKLRDTFKRLINEKE